MRMFSNTTGKMKTGPVPATKSFCFKLPKQDL